MVGRSTSSSSLARTTEKTHDFLSENFRMAERELIYKVQIQNWWDLNSTVERLCNNFATLVRRFILSFLKVLKPVLRHIGIGALRKARKKANQPQDGVMPWLWQEKRLRNPFLPRRNTRRVNVKRLFGQQMQPWSFLQRVSAKPTISKIYIDR